MELRKGWLARQCKRVEDDVKTWPAWMRRAMKGGESMTDNRPIDGDEIVEVTRVLKYRGPRAWIESTLQGSAIQPEKPLRLPREAIISEASRTMTIPDEV